MLFFFKTINQKDFGIYWREGRDQDKCRHLRTCLKWHSQGQAKKKINAGKQRLRHCVSHQKHNQMKVKWVILEDIFSLIIIQRL